MIRHNHGITHNSQNTKLPLSFGVILNYSLSHILCIPIMRKSLYSTDTQNPVSLDFMQSASSLI